MAVPEAEVLVGLDEAGVGPAWGSVWAAAVHLPPDAPPPAGLGDSKRLSERARERVRAALLAPGACRHGLGEVTAAEVDALGLGEARRLVFERALDDYAARHPDALPTRLVVDGTLFRAWRGVPHACVPRADATVPCAAAASILAKTTRDAQVLAACDADPALDERYALRGNKGYLSAAHTAGLRAHGYDARHRRSYRIRALDAGAAGASS